MPTIGLIKQATILWECMERAAIDLDEEWSLQTAYEYGVAVGVFTQFLLDKKIGNEEDIIEAVGQKRYDSLDDLAAKIQCALELN